MFLLRIVGYCILAITVVFSFGLFLEYIILRDGLIYYIKLVATIMGILIAFIVAIPIVEAASIILEKIIKKVDR